MNNASILVIDDEASIRKLLSITLHANGYSVLEADTGQDGVATVAAKKPDLVLLDLGLPDVSGHEVLKHLRDWYTNPIIIISAHEKEEDITKALNNGANDYIIKPFHTNELIARIRAALRKLSKESNMAMATFQDLTIDYANREIKKEGKLINLTATEYSLLALLANNEGKVLTHQYILNRVWGAAQEKESQYLRVFIAQLRKKIEKNPNRPSFIITESGVGYRFVGN